MSFTKPFERKRRVHLIRNQFRTLVLGHLDQTIADLYAETIGERMSRIGREQQDGRRNRNAWFLFESFEEKESGGTRSGSLSYSTLATEK